MEGETYDGVSARGGGARTDGGGGVREGAELEE